MRIAIDIDSTLHHYWPLLSAAAKRRFGIELPYDRQFTWAISRLRTEQLRVCVEDTHSDEAIRSAEPYPHAVGTVNRWHEEGHFIHITSHRRRDSHEVTARWLAEIGLPYDELYCSDDKIERCREIFDCEPIFTSEVGPVIGTYTGPGLLGVGAIPRSLL